MSSTTNAAPRGLDAVQLTKARPGRRFGFVLSHPYTALVLLLGVLLRAVLTPLTHGQDFVVWDLASRGTLAGINIYAHHPHYPGGPYAYTPLFMYLELPMQWAAMHIGWSFTVLGKLPIIAGDILTAVMIAIYFARRGAGDGTGALATALYFLNPLVLYNGAFYGRFDTVCVGLFMLALYMYESSQERAWRFPVVYGLAVAAKIFPGFILPWLWRHAPVRRPYMLAGLVAVVGGISLPYLLTSPASFFADVVLYDGRKLPGNLSWQIIFIDILHLPSQTVRLISYALLALFVIALFLYTRLDLYTYCAVAILLFCTLSKVLIEQYFLWSMPFLIIAAVGRRSWASWGVLSLLSTTGMLINPYIHPLPWGPSSQHGQRILAINLLLGLCMAAYVLTRRPAAASDRIEMHAL